MFLRGEWIELLPIFEIRWQNIIELLWNMQRERVSEWEWDRKIHQNLYYLNSITRAKLVIKHTSQVPHYRLSSITNTHQNSERKIIQEYESWTLQDLISLLIALITNQPGISIQAIT